MSERDDLLKFLAHTIRDFRAGEVPTPTPDHVDRWIRQFDAAVQVPMLRELNHVFQKTYFSRVKVLASLLGLLYKENLAGKDPCSYWRKVHFLDIQQRGRSQAAMLDLFDSLLRKECDLGIAQCGAAGGDFVYLDDVIFSGDHAYKDLKKWIFESAPSNAKVQLVTIAVHKLGEFSVQKRVEEARESLGKMITVSFESAESVENRRTYRNSSEVLWPAEIPEDEATGRYLSELPTKFQFVPRAAGGAVQPPFSSESGRQLLEREFLKAGVRIHYLSHSPQEIVRPLGYGAFGVGFGSLIATYRNCPNNCPLALWWGDPDASLDHPFSKWIPLLPRKTNANADDSDTAD